MDPAEALAAAVSYARVWIVCHMAGDTGPLLQQQVHTPKLAAAAGKHNAGLTDVMIRLYPGGRHEMLNEINRDTVKQDILNWLNEKLENL